MTHHFIAVLQLVLWMEYSNDPQCLPGAYELLRDFCGERHYSEDLASGGFNTIPARSWTNAMIGELVMWLYQYRAK